MGLMSKGVEKSRLRQKQGVIDEAQSTGARLVELVEHELEQNASAVGGTLKALFGGSLKTDAFQAFLLESKGMAHLYVQPYSAANPLPGEHHIILEGTLPRPVILKEGMLGGGKWHAGDDKVYAKMLNGDKALKKASAKVEFEWQIGTGKVELEWGVQIRALPDGKSHLVMQAGRYGGFTTYKVGFEVFQALCRELERLLQSDPGVAEQPFFHEPVFGELFAGLLAGDTDTASRNEEQAIEVPAPPASVDRAALVSQVLGPRQGKKIHVDTIPPKKEKNVRTHVLPEAEQGAAIVAVIDNTMMGSAKDALVFTGTHCYAKEIDDRLSFPLGDVLAVHGYGGKLEDSVLVEVDRLGSLKVPCGGQGDAALEVFSRLAASRTGS